MIIKKFKIKNRNINIYLNKNFIYSKYKNYNMITIRLISTFIIFVCYISYT